MRPTPAWTVFAKYTGIIWRGRGSSRAARTFVRGPALFMSVLISHYCVALRRRAATPEECGPPVPSPGARAAVRACLKNRPRLPR
jgi:hypothetical protein